MKVLERCGKLRSAAVRRDKTGCELGQLVLTVSLSVWYQNLNTLEGVQEAIAQAGPPVVFR